MERNFYIDVQVKNKFNVSLVIYEAVQKLQT